MEKTMEKIVALAKGRGFIYPGSEIYGGLANTWDYGNLGVELKNNVKKAWWQKFIQENKYNVGVDCAILMNPQTWVASGHLGGFSDPLMDCKECHERFRADQLIGTKSLMTFFTIHQRIGKAAQVSGCYPCLWVHQNRTVHTNIVFILLNKLLPPGFLNIVFQLDTKISVVPCICQSTINLRTRINKSASFCQSYDFFHCLFHSYPPIRCRMHLL